MAITTTAGHVSRALDFFNKFGAGNIWYAIGQQDPWADDTNPPAPVVGTTDVNEIIGFKQAATCYMVIPAGNAWAASTNYAVGNTVMANGNIYNCTTAGTSGTTAPSGTGSSITDNTVVWQYVMAIGTQISYNNQSWQVVSSSSAVQYGARWVYVDTTINGSELPLVTYRQIGVYTGLTKTSGTSVGTLALTPAQVASRGILEVYDNRKPIPRASDQKETLSIVIEF